MVPVHSFVSASSSSCVHVKCSNPGGDVPPRPFGAPPSPPRSPSLAEPAPAGGLVEEILRCDFTVLKHVPKGARGSFAGVLASCLRALMQCGTWDNLEALLLLPKFVLRVPASSRGGAKRRNSAADFVRRRYEDFSSLP